MYYCVNVLLRECTSMSFLGGPLAAQSRCRKSSWGLVGPSVGDLGRPLVAQMVLLGCLWRVLGDLGAISVDLAAILAHSNRIFIDLGSIFAALATVRIELSPAWELHFHAFALWRFTTFGKHDLLAYFA